MQKRERSKCVFRPYFVRAFALPAHSNLELLLLHAFQSSVGDTFALVGAEIRNTLQIENVSAACNLTLNLKEGCAADVFEHEGWAQVRTRVTDLDVIQLDALDMAVREGGRHRGRRR